MCLYFQVVISIGILISNAMIVAAIHRNKYLHKVTYYLIGNLAIADLVFGICLTLRFFLLVLNRMSFTPCMVVLSLLVTSSGASVTFIAFLSFERYLAVKHVYSFKVILTNTTVWKLIISCWIYWLFYGFIAFAIPAKSSFTNSHDIACYMGNGFQNDYYLFVTTIKFLLHQLVIWYFQIVTFRVAKQYLKPASQRLMEQRRGSNHLSGISQNKTANPGAVSQSLSHHKSHCDSIKIAGNRPIMPQMGEFSVASSSGQTSSSVIVSGFRVAVPSVTCTFSSTEQQSTSNRQQQREKMDKLLRTTKLVVSVMGIFSVCWIPFMIFLAIFSICPDHCGMSGIQMTYLSTPLIFNSFINVFIYATKSREFKRAFHEMLCCKSNYVNVANLSMAHPSHCLRE